MPSYGGIEVAQREGAEPFHLAGRPLGFEVLSFWRWAFSDLTGNALRGVVAEYLVAHALGLDADTGRAEWDAVDLRTNAGLAVEVKAAAYLQTWPQEELSDIEFSIAPTMGWNARTNKSESHRARWADVYVFALLHHQDQSTLDPLDLTQWTFYVLPRAVLDAHNPTQQTIVLNSLKRLGPRRVAFDELRAAIEASVAVSDL